MKRTLAALGAIAILSYGLVLAKARLSLTAGVIEALGKLPRFKPYKLASPYNFELGYHVSAQADMGAMIPGAKRIDARTLGFTGADYIEGFRALRAMINIAPAR